MKLKLALLTIKLAGILFTVGLPAAYHTVIALLHTVQQNELSQAVNEWQQELAKQQGFEEWKDATISISALGPGTHSWLVLVYKDKEVIGYMIVHAKQDGGYILGEYGVGDVTSLRLLAEHSSLLSYYDPFHVILTLETDEGIAYIEPFLQEQFPITEQHIAGKSTFQLEDEYAYLPSDSSAVLTDAINVAYFSPYDVMPWLTGNPLCFVLNDKMIDDYSIETNIELGSQIRYTTESWDNTVFAAYSVTGYHKWNELHLYVALQDENEALTRYIDYDSLWKQGFFYEPTVY